ncbi:MAG: calcineurin-like phosphoesterase family protein [Wenzhouxiangellaceae bacterium]
MNIPTRRVQRTRSNRCRFIWLSAALLLGAISPWAVAAPIAGTVYLDANNNRLLDQGESGIAGVLVSNGSDIVETDASGRYQLEVADDDAMVYVLKPRDYQLSRDHQGRPRYWYQHDPDGAPARRYAASPATGQTAGDINFPLRSGADLLPVKVALVADPQVNDEQEVDYYQRDVLSGLQRQADLRLAFVLGDIVNDRLDLYPQINQAQSEIAIPWFNILGNHDQNLDALDDAGSDDTYQAYFGPTTYALQYANVHFIYFDDVIYWRDQRGQARYRGGLRDDQFEFIANYLQHVPGEHWVVLLMHIPLADARRDHRLPATDLQRLGELLSGHPHNFSISGHTHTQQHVYLDAADGWPDGAHYHYTMGAACGSFWSGPLDRRGIPDATMTDGTPNGYAILEFTDDGHYRIDYQVAGETNNPHLRLIGPGSVVRNSYPNAYLYANVFNATPNDVVEYRLDQGQWQPMQRSDEADPYVLMQNFADLTSSQPPSNERLSPASPSTHLWKARIDTHINAGAHQLEVRAIDQFDRTMTERTSFQVYDLEPEH